MDDITFDLPEGIQRGNWIRLRTIIWLRWCAISGQLIALYVAQTYYNLFLEVGLFYLVVGLSVIANIVAMFIFPESKRLSERENLLMVMFDLLQLCALLYLTGGLHNPFAMLVVGPVAVSAAALSLRSTIFLGGLAIVLVSLLSQYHIQLRTEHGFILRVPDVFIFGNWAAIIISLAFLSVYVRRISSETNSMSDALKATHLALAREQKLTDLGGVVAAAAHELGTPLATIKLVSYELIDDLADHELSNNADALEDLRLISEQADRCRDILRSMGRAGKDDLYLRQAPLTTVIHEAAEPHMDRGKTIHFKETPNSAPQPSILRRPEMIHGLRNLIQNAVDFAAENVWVEISWSNEQIIVYIQDDGPGFPPHHIGRIGNPFLRRRKPTRDKTQRPGYEGMGLGLFIAKTLLERTGAALKFSNFPAPEIVAGLDANKSIQSGALVRVTWPLHKIDATSEENAIPIGRNMPFET